MINLTQENTENNQNENQEDSKNNSDKKPKREFILNKDVKAESVQPIIEGINDVNRYDDEQEEKDQNYVRKPIKLIIDSFGGSIYDGLALANTIDTSKTHVHGYVLGKAMSMGLAIFSICHKRFAHVNATLMYHDASTAIGDKIEGIQQYTSQVKRLVKVMDYNITNNSIIKQSKLDRIKREKKDWYMFGSEAFELGLVDELLKSTRKTVDIDKK